MKGNVFIRFTVTKKGNVENPEVLNGLCEKANDIALDIVRQLKFQPALYYRKEVEVTKMMPIEFH